MTAGGRSRRVTERRTDPVTMLVAVAREGQRRSPSVAGTYVPATCGRAQADVGPCLRGGHRGIVDVEQGKTTNRRSRDGDEGSDSLHVPLLPLPDRALPLVRLDRSDRPR